MAEVAVSQNHAAPALQPRQQSETPSQKNKQKKELPEHERNEGKHFVRGSGRNSLKKRTHSYTLK